MRKEKILNTIGLIVMITILAVALYCAYDICFNMTKEEQQEYMEQRMKNY